VKFINLTGKKFGRLRVIKRVYPNSKCGHAKWLCRCDCGAERIVEGANLRGRTHTKSCGCLQKEIMSNRKLNFGLASMRDLIQKYRKNAEKRGQTYDLTEDQFAELTKEECHYCGAKPNNTHKHKECFGGYTYNGLDRIDNSQGYTINNVVPCCRVCNYAKGTRTEQEFKDWIKIVYYKIFKNF